MTAENTAQTEDTDDFDTVPCFSSLSENTLNIDFGRVNNANYPITFSTIEADGTVDGTYLVVAKLRGYQTIDLEIELSGLFIAPGKHIFDIKGESYLSQRNTAYIKLKPSAFATSNGFESVDGSLYIEKLNEDSMILSFCNQTLFYTTNQERIAVSGSIKAPITEVYNY